MNRREALEEMRKLKREALKEVSQLQHRLDQISAQARDEGRDLNYLEWEEIHDRVGRLCD